MAVGSSQWKLGAEAQYIIIERIKTFLDNRTALQDGAQTWKWIASFEEGHGSLYARKFGDRYLLMAKDSEAKTLAEFSLTEDDVQSWLAVLNTWRQ